MTTSNALADARTALWSACADFRTAAERGDMAAVAVAGNAMRAAVALIEQLEKSVPAPLVVAHVVVTDAGGEGGSYWETTVVVDGREVSGYSTESGVDAVIDALQRSKRGHEVEESADGPDDEPEIPRRYDDSVWDFSR